jgi:putative membrane protein
MSWVARIPCRVWLLIIVLGLFALSAINPANPGDFILEHSFTAAVLAALIALDRRRPVSNAAATLLFIYLCLHILGAHYTYSFVPYDEWSRAIFGRGINETFGWERNHYDRLVHLAFGLLILHPMRELIVERFTPLRGWWSIGVSIAFLAMFSKVYELMEWIFAEVMSEEAAETYNGQQGDMFDAQKDMGLALAGSIASGMILALRERAERAAALHSRES